GGHGPPLERRWLCRRHLARVLGSSPKVLSTLPEIHAGEFPLRARVSLEMTAATRPLRRPFPSYHVPQSYCRRMQPKRAGHTKAFLLPGRAHLPMENSESLSPCD